MTRSRTDQNIAWLVHNPPRVDTPASEIAKVIDGTQGAGTLRLPIATTDISSNDLVKTLRLKLRPGDKIQHVVVPNARPEPFLFALQAFALLAFVTWLQRRRRDAIAPGAPATA